MEFDIVPRTHYLVITGSYAYGTERPESDYDLRGWAIPPREYFFAFDKHFEQDEQAYPYKDYPFKNTLAAYIGNRKLRVPADNEVIDHSIYDIRKFFALAAGCNPNVIELLFVDDREVLALTSFGEHVRKNRELFLSARAKHTYTGYAVSQLKRINGHRRFLLHPLDHKPTRSEYGLPETSVISPEQRGAAEALVDAKVRGWMLQDTELSDKLLDEYHDRLSDFLANMLSSRDLIIRFKDESELFEAARLVAMKNLGFTENYISVLQAEKKYRDKLKDWDHYQTWVRERNPERAAWEAKYGYDIKHAMHLVRLLIAGREVLTTGNLNVRCKEIQTLKDIREGKWTYEQLIQYLEKTDKELQEIYDTKKYVVPHKPDMKALSKICTEIVNMANFAA